MSELSLLGFFKQFPDEMAARKHFEDLRWVGKRCCPYCNSENTSEIKNEKPMPYRCKDCRKHFSVRTGTILSESKLPFQKWLLAMYILTSSEKGISSIYLSKVLECTQKTAWFLAHRIREVWKQCRS